MKTIVFEAQYNTRWGSEETPITVRARDINSGFRKAARVALLDLPEFWDLCEVKFVEVK